MSRSSGKMHPSPYPEATVEMICKPLAEATRGWQIASLISSLNTVETASEQSDTKWKRLFSAVIAAQERQRDGRPLLRLVSEIMAPVRFDSPDDFEAHRTAVNERLLLCGYAVRSDGRLEVVESARTLTEAQQRADFMRGELQRRGVHPDVLRHCRAELMQQNYFHAVLEASKSVAEKIRVLTDLDLDGSRLVDAACASSTGRPLIAFNSLATESERSEQKGLATLIKGVFGSFRNPTAHAPKVRWATSREDALDILTLISMLHRRLDVAAVYRDELLEE